MDFSGIDIGIFIGYICCIMGFGIWIANREKNVNSQDYFLASKSLPWWAVGGSLIASNISTEQILGMNGTGYVAGMAVAAYELMAAFTLIIVAKFFLPVFIKKGIYSMPQFLEMRYNQGVRIGLAFFWVALFVFINITSIFYLGGLATEALTGVPMGYAIVGLVIYSATFSIFGGLKAVVWTDVIQAVVLVIGGLFAAYFVVSAVAGADGGFFAGLSTMFEKAPEKFDMILSSDNPSYGDLPGIAVLIGGLWIANLYYWGLNQYIIQRALAAKNVHEAQKGVAFAGFLKLLMPLIAVLPGIAVFVLGGEIDKPDEAFPWVLKNYVPIGLKGLTFAALIAAIGSSISSMVNSTSTIFTLDIYKTLINENASEKSLVSVGRITAGAALIIGALVAPALSSLDQAFQFIQEFTGFIAPGILVVFVFGLFWKRASANAAMSVVILSIPLSFALKYFFPELPFLDRMGFCFLLLSSLMLGVSLLENSKAGGSKDIPYKLLVFGSILLISIPSGFKILIEDTEVSKWFGYVILGLSAVVAYVLFSEQRADDPKAITIEKGLFKTDSFFNISAIAITLVLAVIYTLLW
ncbi:MAG: sodium/solute symporter [Bacteroidota bacterium]